jgi:hypothetical protein
MGTPNQSTTTITPEQFESYVEIQMSGITNMGNVSYVCQLTGLTRDECIYIMRNYSELKDRAEGVDIESCL